MAAAALCFDKSHRLLHLPRGCHGDNVCFGIRLLLHWRLHWSPVDDDGSVPCFLHHLVWTDVLSRPHLCGVLPGCRSPRHLHAPEKWQQGQNQIYHHWVCLATAFCKGECYGSKLYRNYCHGVQQAILLAVVSFCSLAVLGLKHPGPGEGGGNRERDAQSKQRAFNTIMAIMGTLLLWFGGCLVCTAIYSLLLRSSSNQCVVIVSSFWFSLPSSQVLPLLFRHRAGKTTIF